MALQPRRLTRERYHKTSRTIERWERDPKLGFPRPTYINGRKYDDPAALDEFDARMAEAGRAAVTPRRRA
jgi:hypothetical protein